MVQLALDGGQLPGQVLPPGAGYWSVMAFIRRRSSSMAVEMEDSSAEAEDMALVYPKGITG